MIIAIGTEIDIDKMNHAIIAYNLKQIPFPANPPWKTLSYVYKKDEELLAGIYGYLIMNNVLKIDVLYVNETLRNKGYGSKLLQHLEAEAKKQSAYLALLDTYDFQALGFYQKNGYEIFGTVENCPAPNHVRYSLKKCF